jgi:fumarate reductase subunit D
MNAITQVVLVLVLWLIMGLGFLSKASETRRKGQPMSAAWFSWEGLFFFLSVIVPLAVLIHRNIDG